MKKESKAYVKCEMETKENHLSSFGGVPLFMEFLKGVGFDRVVTSLFQPKSNQGYHPLHHILSTILINVTGGESVADVNDLEMDSGIKRVLKKFEKLYIGLKGRIFTKERNRRFPSESAIFRFLDKFNSPNEEKERQTTEKGTSKILPVNEEFKNLVSINNEIIKIAQEIDPKKEATLDMDNNLILSHKSNAMVSYKKKSSYHPFNVYWHEQNLMVFSEFRDGNVPAGKEQQRILEAALKGLPSTVEKVMMRSDSAGYQHTFLEYMDSGKSSFGKIHFAVSCDVSKSLRNAILKIPENQWQKVVKTDKDGISYETKAEVAEVCFIPTTKNNSKNAPIFRYIVTREPVDIQSKFDSNGQMSFMTSEYVEQKLHLEEMNNTVYKTFGIVTNMKGTPLDILTWHRLRCGRSEKEHSRLTKDMAGGRMPSDSFGENAAWWYISIISLNLLKLFQRNILPKDLHHVRIKKLSSVLLRIAVKVIKQSGDIILKVGKDMPIFTLIKQGQKKILKIEKLLKQSDIWIKNSQLVIC